MRGGCGTGLTRARLPVTPGMVGSCGLNGLRSLGSSDTCASAKIGKLQLELLCRILQAGYALEVNGCSGVDRRARRMFAKAKRDYLTANSSRTFDAHGMVRHVLVEIGKD